MGVLDYIKDKVLGKIKTKSIARFLQYQHSGNCETPCPDCPPRHNRIYENGMEVKLPAHFGCDCHYNDVLEQPAGSISNKGILAPDVYLKAYGKLPNYYITKEEAAKLGYGKRDNLAEYAPGKMIGGDIYRNKNKILPEKEGRIWFYCDVDFISGNRGSKRLYYSNDGLMFYTETHHDYDVVFIK